MIIGRHGAMMPAVIDTEFRLDIVNVSTATSTARFTGRIRVHPTFETQESRGLLLWLPPRQPNTESAAFSRSCAERVDCSVVFFDDAMGNAEAESRALPRLFR